jgi:hypothetical protein
VCSPIPATVIANPPISTDADRRHKHTKGVRTSLEDRFNDPSKQIDIGPAADTNDKQEDHHFPKSGMGKCVAEPCPYFRWNTFEGGLRTGDALLNNPNEKQCSCKYAISNCIKGKHDTRADNPFVPSNRNYPSSDRRPRDASNIEYQRIDASASRPTILGTITNRTG